MEPAPHDQDGITRLALTKTWAGDLVGEGVGTMLSAGDPASGSAGYVALETVTGTLHGRSGDVALQQMGVADAGDQELRYQVVPGSGTRELAGIRGTLDLRILDGVHRYELTYLLDGDSQAATA